MGLIRLLLAFSVLIAHSVFFLRILPPGDISVQLFFIISGFYMAMILNTKYKSHTAAFFANRFLRLYPIYVSVLLLIVGLGLFSTFVLGDPTSHWDRSAVNFHFGDRDDVFQGVGSGLLSLPAGLFLIFSNVSMMFQDLVMFLRLEAGNLVFGDFTQSSPPLFTFLLMPQAWSLSVEILFYLCAPFLVKSKKRLLVAVVLSVALRLALHALGKTGDPFSYRFFPSELSLFALGALAWHLHRSSPQKVVETAVPWLLGLVLLLLLFWPYLFSFDDLSRYLFFVPFAFLVPYFYQRYKDSDLLNRIGELSYPFYLLHLFSLEVAGKFVFAFLPASHLRETLVVLVATVLCLSLSVLLMETVQARVEKMRRRNLEKIKTEDALKALQVQPSSGT